MDKRAAQVFSKLMKFREEADYNPISMFTKEDFVAFKGEAEIFAASAKSYLVGSQFLKGGQSDA